MDTELRKVPAELHTNLRNFLDSEPEIWLKYSFCIRLDEINEYNEKHFVVRHGDPGAVMLRGLTARQKFYSNINMIECHQDLTTSMPKGKRITRIRDLIFIDSQLYVKTTDNVFKLKDDNGFIDLKISSVEYRSILDQLKRKKYKPWQRS